MFGPVSRFAMRTEEFSGMDQPIREAFTLLPIALLLACEAQIEPRAMSSREGSAGHDNQDRETPTDLEPRAPVTALPATMAMNRIWTRSEWLMHL